MSAEMHTPGPWKVRKMMRASNFDTTPRFAVETDDDVICETRPIKSEDRESYNAGQTLANAELIASAPALRATLAQAVQAMEWARCVIHNTLEAERESDTPITEQCLVLIEARKKLIEALAACRDTKGGGA